MFKNSLAALALATAVASPAIADDAAQVTTPLQSTKAPLMCTFADANDNYIPSAPTSLERLRSLLPTETVLSRLQSLRNPDYQPSLEGN